VVADARPDENLLRALRSGAQSWTRDGLPARAAGVAVPPVCRRRPGALPDLAAVGAQAQGEDGVNARRDLPRILDHGADLSLNGALVDGADVDIASTARRLGAEQESTHNQEVL
jgi:hypothetical protein